MQAHPIEGGIVMVDVKKLLHPKPIRIAGAGVCALVLLGAGVGLA